jgi:hypothetical protein
VALCTRRAAHEHAVGALGERAQHFVEVFRRHVTVGIEQRDERIALVEPAVADQAVQASRLAEPLRIRQHVDARVA